MFAKSDKGAAASAPHGPASRTPDPVYATPYKISINYERREDQGEDAAPIWAHVAPAHGIIGVFDGLGGAGAERFRLENGEEHTGAWVASRLARSRVLSEYREFVVRTQSAVAAGGSDLYDQESALPQLDQPYDFTVELRRNLQDTLVRTAAGFGSGGGGSLLKSRMIKMLPTTLAICVYDLGAQEATAIWAGDSRVYRLDPRSGLQQITTDDLKSNADALENLKQDSPMSNCVSADTDFVLHERRIPVEPGSILIAATDGCFGYVQTPLHFEHMLLSSMHAAASWDEWQVQLQADIVRVTADDSTLAAVALGWKDFNECRKAFATRHRSCAQRYQIFENLRLRVADLDRELDAARAALAAGTKSLWDEYRVMYEGLASGPTRDVSGGGRGDAKRGDAKRADPKREDAKRADVTGADATREDLKVADLKGADVKGADVKHADVKAGEDAGREVARTEGGDRP